MSKTKNIVFGPVPAEDIDPEEALVPLQSKFVNGTVTHVGNWSQRPGFAEYVDVGVDKPIDCLIPSSNGYAITQDGLIYRNILTSPNLLTGGRLYGESRPTWVGHNSDIVVCDGGPPAAIGSTGARTLGGNPPFAKFVERISEYTIMAGYHDTEFKWCASGNPENWSTGDSGFANIQKTGDPLLFMSRIGDKLFFFKSFSIEPWIHLGGETPFVRYGGTWMNIGLGAAASVVKANETLYFFGNDNRFYLINNFIPQVIGQNYRDAFQDLASPSSIYGFHCKAEQKIRWVAPVDGRCFVFDYVKDLFTEESLWLNGSWECMPYGSYMEIGGKQLFGDRGYTGKIYRMGPDIYSDNGSPLRVYRRFSLIPDPAGNQVRVDSLRFRLTRGVATDAETSPLFAWRHRFDRGDWQYWNYIDLGARGDANPWQEVDTLGIGREIEFEMVASDAVSLLLTHANMTYTVLSI